MQQFPRNLSLRTTDACAMTVTLLYKHKQGEKRDIKKQEAQGA